MRPASELAAEVSELMGEQVSADQVLDSLGIIADPDHPVDVDAPEVVGRVLHQRELLESPEGSFGELLNYYWEKGLIGLSVPVAQHLFRGRLTGVETMNRDTVLTEEQRTRAVEFLTPWTAICKLLKQDRALPKRGPVSRDAKPNTPVEQHWYVFTGRCGHEVRQSVGEVDRYRATNTNPNAPIYQELCNDCLQKRAKVLFTPPDAVNPEHPETLVCGRCGGDLFVKGPGSAYKSRSDRYQNAMSGTTNVISLFNGLKSEHPSRNATCTANLRKRAEEQAKNEKERELALLQLCDNDIADIKQTAYEAMDDHPAARKAILAGLPDRIKEKRAAFGLPTSDSAYQARRVKAGLARPAPKKSAASSR
jgi:hypothetical protein